MYINVKEWNTCLNSTGDIPSNEGDIDTIEQRCA